MQLKFKPVNFHLLLFLQWGGHNSTHMEHQNWHLFARIRGSCSICSEFSIYREVCTRNFALDYLNFDKLS